MPIQPNFLERTAIYNLNLVPGVILDLGGALAFQTLALAAQMGLYVELLRRCAVALKPGGQLAIMDQIAGKVPGNVANAVIRLIAPHYFLLADGRVYK